MVLTFVASGVGFKASSWKMRSMAESFSSCVATWPLLLERDKTAEGGTPSTQQKDRLSTHAKERRRREEHPSSKRNGHKKHDNTAFFVG